MKILFTGLDPTRFRMLGKLIHRPALQLVRNEAGYRALPDIIEKLTRGAFDWIVFTGRPAVEPFISAVEDFKLDAAALDGTRIAAAGAGTEECLTECGLRVDAVPSEPGKRGILHAIGTARKNRILVVQGSHSPLGLEEAINDRGWSGTFLCLRRVAPHPQLGRALPEYDAVYFVSPSGVRNYWQAYGEEAFRKEVWCMGDMTLAEVTGLGRKGKVVDPCDGNPQVG
ncbi:MAG: uroporphyrinogen-III synthase [Planctomycetota bacterium]|nr:MAG: uroporphyrinogen-III synthase [Planctomycetota bacterium]